MIEVVGNEYWPNMACYGIEGLSWIGTSCGYSDKLNGMAKRFHETSTKFIGNMQFFIY